MTDTKTEIDAAGRPSRRSRSISFDPSAPLLEVEDLQVEFHTRDGVAQAVQRGQLHACARARPSASSASPAAASR